MCAVDVHIPLLVCLCSCWWPFRIVGEEVHGTQSTSGFSSLNLQQVKSGRPNSFAGKFNS